MATQTNKYDILNLQNSKAVRQMFAKQGMPDSSVSEMVVLSTKVVKINRKGKDQERVLIVSNQNMCEYVKVGKTCLGLRQQLQLQAKQIRFAKKKKNLLTYILHLRDGVVIHPVITDCYQQLTKCKKFCVVTVDEESLVNVTWTRTYTNKVVRNLKIQNTLKAKGEKERGRDETSAKIGQEKINKLKYNTKKKKKKNF
ncbi:hypothetical protein RFI_15431 [Reticulomyxa filosa]|uniref:Uncharacterized protein n=1 Tax=Reticulomyxa filosa TaxID=46433 RepID=X6N8Z5_RETFI|nr:hypothetical protein RFI_15431 [Reticulomyxa filosa]|eukprot:ETO21772.1 hypothetical protein RFI_15431 [Reticulomyxa filosa]